MGSHASAVRNMYCQSQPATNCSFKVRHNAAALSRLRNQKNKHWHGLSKQRTRTNPAPGHARSGPDYLHQQVLLIPGCTECLSPNKCAKLVFGCCVFLSELNYTIFICSIRVQCDLTCKAHLNFIGIFHLNFTL